ncbi:glucose-6-phosphate isomerase 1, chloroplastic [Tanacetum coccineum]
MFESDTIKLDRMDGMNFTRWKEKMKFLLTAFKVYYVLEGPPVGVMTEEEQRKREQDETLCRGYILSTLTDRLYDLYTPMTSAREIWNSLEEKYTAERMGQINYQKKLMHTSEDFTLDQIQKHLRIEEETRIREKNLNDASGSKVNYVDSGKNNKGNDKKGKGTWNSSKNNKKDKKPLSEVVCYKCGEKGHIRNIYELKRKLKGTWNSSKNNKKDKKPLSEVVGYKCGEKGHIKRYCKNPKKKNQNSNKKDESANAVEQVDITEITAMVFEMNIGMIQELHMLVTTMIRWYDSVATTPRRLLARTRGIPSTSGKKLILMNVLPMFPNIF